jgi:glycosyltransferase involved in cell wall biosynthesis
LKNCNVAVIIPAFNEEMSIKLVVRDIPRYLVSEIVIVDNGSTDNTGAEAREAGTRVVFEPKHGYGSACKAGVKYLEKTPPPIVVFLDADYSDYPNDMTSLIQPILSQRADLVLGSRLMLNRKNAVSSHVIAANRFFSKLINFLYGLNLTDLGPFRAIRWDSLKRLDMRSENYGWSCEMIVKAAKQNLTIVEIPVRYRRRMGKSKISGSFWRSLQASISILYNVVRHKL